jgi:hypothetical protein
MRNQIILAKWCTTFSGGRWPLRQAASDRARSQPGLDLAQDPQAPSEDIGLPSKRSDQALP